MIVTNINPEIDTEEPKGRHVKDGFQDPSGSFPKVEYVGKSGLNFRAQGDVTDVIVSTTYRSAKPSTMDIQVAQKKFG